MIHCWAMVWTKVDPAPEMLPDAHVTDAAWPVLDVVPFPLLDELLSLPHAPATSASDTTGKATRAQRLRLFFRLRFTRWTLRATGSAAASQW